MMIMIMGVGCNRGRTATIYRLAIYIGVIRDEKCSSIRIFVQVFLFSFPLLPRGNKRNYSGYEMYIILKCILDYMKRYDALYSIQIIAMNTSRLCRKSGTIVSNTPPISTKTLLRKGKSVVRASDLKIKLNDHFKSAAFYTPASEPRAPWVLHYDSRYKLQITIRLVATAFTRHYCQCNPT